LRAKFKKKVWILTRKHELRSKRLIERIRHTFLLTTEKKFIENERKMPILDVFFEQQQLIQQPNILSPNF
jgi:hypothetical protein